MCDISCMSLEITEDWIARQSPEVQAIIQGLLARIAEQDRRLAELELELKSFRKTQDGPGWFPTWVDGVEWRLIRSQPPWPIGPQRLRSNRGQCDCECVLVREVEVLFRQTLSGLYLKETASSRGGVGNNWRRMISP